MVEHIRVETKAKDAEGANLEQANPDETLRQKDPVPTELWKVPFGTPTV